MSQRIVVTGTDTEIGKTVFSAGLADFLGANYWKPIQAGLEGETDSQLVARLGGLSDDRIVPERYRLETPASPYHAAAIDGVRIDAESLNLPDTGARGVFNAAYEPLLFDVTTVPFPASRYEQATLDALEVACRNENPAAFIVEPLILGAGGMLMYPAWVLKEMKRICEASDVLFIADEVMTGWGRTGTLFACEQADVSPDIVCYSKGLTGGSLPLAVTLCCAEIFEAHYSKDRTRTFFHSSSYTANPVACAAAKANLDLWRNQESRQRVASVVAMQEKGIQPFRADARFKNVRRIGTITALDLEVSDGGYLAGIGPKLQAFFNSRNVLLRPLGNTIYVMPPYCVTAADLNEIYAAISDAADTLV